MELMGCDEYWDAEDAFEPSSPDHAQQPQSQQLQLQQQQHAEQEDEIEEEFHPGEQGDDDDGGASEDDAATAAAGGGGGAANGGANIFTLDGSLSASASMDASINGGASALEDSTTLEARQILESISTPPPPAKSRRSPYNGPFHFGIASAPEEEQQQQQQVNVTPQQPQLQPQQQRASTAKQHPLFGGDDGGLDALSLEDSSDSTQFPTAAPAAAATQPQPHARPPKTGHGRRRDDQQQPQQPSQLDHEPPTSSFAAGPAAIAPVASGRLGKKYPSEGLHLSPAPTQLGYAPFPSSKQPLGATVLPPTQIVNRLSRPPLGAISAVPAPAALSRDSSVEEDSQQPQQQQQMPGRPGGGRSFNSRERKSSQPQPQQQQQYSQFRGASPSSFDQSSDLSGSESLLDSSATGLSLVDPHNHPAYGSAAGGAYGMASAGAMGAASDSDEDSLESLQHSHGSSSSVMSASAAAAALAQAVAAPSPGPAPALASAPLIPAFAKPPLGSRNMLAPAAGLTGPPQPLASAASLGRPSFESLLPAASSSAGAHFPGGKAMLLPKANFGAQAAAALPPPRNMLSAGINGRGEQLQQQQPSFETPAGAAMERPKSGRQRGGGTPDVVSMPLVSGSPPLGPRRSRRGRHSQSEEEDEEEEEAEDDDDAGQQHGGAGEEAQILTLNTPPDSAQSTPFRSPALDHDASTSVSGSGSGSVAGSPASDGPASRHGQRGAGGRGGGAGVFSAHFEQLDLEDLSSTPKHAQAAPLQQPPLQQPQLQSQQQRSPSFATKMLSGGTQRNAAAAAAAASTTAEVAAVPLRRRSFGTPPLHPQSTPDSPDLVPAAALSYVHDHNLAAVTATAGPSASTTPPSGSAASSPPQSLTHIVITPPSLEMISKPTLAASAMRRSGAAPPGAAPSDLDASPVGDVRSPSKAGSGGGGGGWASQHIQPTRLALKFGPVASIALFYDLFDAPQQQHQTPQQQRTLLDRRVHLMPLGALDPPQSQHRAANGRPAAASSWDWTCASVDEIVSRLYALHPHYLGSSDAPTVSAQQLAALVGKIKTQQQSQQRR